MVATPTENRTENQTQGNASYLLGVPAADLRLRVCTGHRHGLVIRIAAERCTIGSARQCTLRLRDRQVSPVHCLIVRGALGTLVRRWSPDTLLNGAPFQDAALRSGDRLRCGPLELEVLPPETTPGAEDSHTADSAPAPRKGTSQEIDAFRERVQLARNRSRRLVMAVRAARGRSVQLEWQLEEEQIKHQRFQSRTDVERREAEQRIETATDRIATLGEELARTQTARDDLQRQLCAEQEIICGLRDQLAELRQPLTEPAASEPAAAEHVLRPQDTGVTPEPTDASAEENGAASQVHRLQSDQPRADQPHPDDPSIESYLAALLKRVRGSSARPDCMEEIPAEAASRIVREPVPLVADHVPEAETDQPPTAALAPRRRPPEETDQLAAMWELATLSADRAIDQHAWQRQYLKAVGKLAVGAAGFVSAAALIAFSHFQSSGRDTLIPWLLTTVAVLIGVVWGLRGIHLLRKIRRRQRQGDRSGAA